MDMQRCLCCIVTTVWSLHFSTYFAHAEGNNGWDLCQSARTLIDQRSLSGINVVGDLTLNFTNQVTYYDANSKAIDTESTETLLVDLCKCSIYARDRTMFDINLSLVKDTYKVNPFCSSDCRDWLKVITYTPTGQEKQSPSFDYDNTWSKETIHGSLFQQNAYQLKIVYDRYISSPPNVKYLDIHLTATKPLIIDCTAVVKPAFQPVEKPQEKTRVINNQHHEDTSTYAKFPIIIGGIVGGGAFIILVIVAVFFIRHRSEKERLQRVSRRHYNAQNSTQIRHLNGTNPFPTRGTASGPDQRYIDLEDMREIDRRAKNPNDPVLEPFIDSQAYMDISTVEQEEQNTVHNAPDASTNENINQSNPEVEEERSQPNPTSANYYNLPGDDYVDVSQQNKVSDESTNAPEITVLSHNGIQPNTPTNDTNTAYYQIWDGKT